MITRFPAGDGGFHYDLYEKRLKNVLIGPFVVLFK